MFRLTAKVEIKSAKKWVFDKVSSVEVTRDTETLTDTCVLQLPKKIKWQGEKNFPLKRGDEVIIHLGYDDNLQSAFYGFITEIGSENPTSITCEDYMFKLKQLAAQKKAYKSAALDQILGDQNLGIEYRVFGEQHIGQYRVTAETVSGLLANLKDQFGIKSFIRVENGNPILFCGVLFEREKQHTQVFATGVNLIEESQLKTQRAEDLKLKVTAISLLPNNKKVYIEIGDPDGEIVKLHTYNKTEQELKVWAEQELKRLKQDGMSGSFTTFGTKLVEKLDNIGLKIDGDRKGIYQVRKNVIQYSSNGFRQEITIGTKVAE